MLRLQEVAGIPGAETLPIPQGRAAIEHQAAMTGRTQPIGAVRDLTVEDLPARLYTPRGATSGSPVLLFFHGGGFVYGGLDSHDASCRVLAEGAGCRVLAIDYRLAPEAPFPAAYDDALTALRWLAKNADSIGADADKIAVGGDSAGGNLAAAVAQAAVLEGLPVAFQLLVYPATDNFERATRSAQLFGEGFYLTQGFMDVASESYTPDPETRRDWRASPARGEVSDALAPAYVATAGFDPLRDEGEAYARMLADAGVPVELQAVPRPDPRVLQHRGRRAALARGGRRDRRGAEGRARLSSPGRCSRSCAMNSAGSTIVASTSTGSSARR